MALASGLRRPRLPTQRSAIRLCRMERSDMAAPRVVHRDARSGLVLPGPFSILTITRARWSRPRWSVGDMLKTPCAPCTSRADSSASRSARGTRPCPAWPSSAPARRRRAISRPASQACAPKVETEPLPYRGLVLGDVVACALALTGLFAGSCAATSTGPDGRNVPSTSLPPTRRKSLLATPCVW